MVTEEAQEIDWLEATNLISLIWSQLFFLSFQFQKKEKDHTAEKDKLSIREKRQAKKKIGSSD